MTFLFVFYAFIAPAILVLMAWAGIKWNDRSIRLSKAAEAAAQANRTGGASAAP
jgi:hypothetical protein